MKWSTETKLKIFYFRFSLTFQSQIYMKNMFLIDGEMVFRSRLGVKKSKPTKINNCKQDGVSVSVIKMKGVSIKLNVKLPNVNPA